MSRLGYRLGVSLVAWGLFVAAIWAGPLAGSPASSTAVACDTNPCILAPGQNQVQVVPGQRLEATFSLRAGHVSGGTTDSGVVSVTGVPNLDTVDFQALSQGVATISVIDVFPLPPGQRGASLVDITWFSPCPGPQAGPCLGPSPTDCGPPACPPPLPTLVLGSWQVTVAPGPVPSTTPVILPPSFGPRLPPPPFGPPTVPTPPASGRHHHGPPYEAQVGKCGPSCQGTADPDLAVSPNYLVEITNSQLTVFKRSPDLVASWVTDLTSITHTATCSDVTVVYWAWDDRFAFACDTEDEQLAFAVSKSSDPRTTNDWWSYVFPVGEGTGNKAHCADQPSLTVTADKIAITDTAMGNRGGPNDCEGATGTDFWVFDKQLAMAGALDPTKQFQWFSDPHAPFRAVKNISRVSDATFVGVDGFGPAGLWMATLSGRPGHVRSPQVQLVQGGSGMSYSMLPDVPVPGGIQQQGFVGGGDMNTRILSAQQEQETSDRDNVILLTNMASNCAGAVICMELTKLDLSGTRPTVRSQWQAAFAPGVAQLYPTATMDAYGHVFVSSTLIHPNQDLPAATAEAYSDGSSSHHWGQVFLAPNNPALTPCDYIGCNEGLGDYLGAMQDPSDPTHVWFLSEWQYSTGGQGWGTAIAEGSWAGFAR